MITKDTSHNLKNISVNYFKLKQTIKTVKINSKNLISDQEINKVNLKSPSKTVSLINKKIIILNHKKTNSNKLYKEPSHKLINLSKKEISIWKSMIKTELKLSLMSILILMKIINKKLLKNWEVKYHFWKLRRDLMKTPESMLNFKACMMQHKNKITA